VRASRTREAANALPSERRLAISFGAYTHVEGQRTQQAIPRRAAPMEDSAGDFLEENPILIAQMGRPLQRCHQKFITLGLVG
jgi:hypothetical protein